MPLTHGASDIGQVINWLLYRIVLWDQRARFGIIFMKTHEQAIARYYVAASR